MERARLTTAVPQSFLLSFFFSCPQRCIDFQKHLRTCTDHQYLMDHWLNNSALMAYLLNQELVQGLDLHLKPRLFILHVCISFKAVKGSFFCTLFPLFPPAMKGSVLSAQAADFCVLKVTHCIRNFVSNATKCQKDLLPIAEHKTSLNGGKQRL